MKEKYFWKLMPKTKKSGITIGWVKKEKVPAFCRLKLILVMLMNSGAASLRRRFCFNKKHLHIKKTALLCPYKILF